MVERSAVLGRRRSPLQRLAQELESGSSAELALREIPFLAQIGLRVEPSSPSAVALEWTLTGALPAEVGDVTDLPDDRHLLWIGPDDFLLVAPDEADCGTDPARTTDELSTALGGLPGQVVDLSANRTTLELHGPRSQDVLDKSCRLDLDPIAFPAGSALVTLLGTVGVILWRVEQNTWRIMPRSSFATHTARWLLDGMREFV
jgi:sarcosine oxidase, subunit gamma